MENNSPKLKIERREFIITEKDWVLDNESCVQLMTQDIVKGFNNYSPVLSKKLVSDLKKNGVFYQDEETEKIEKRRYSNNAGCKVYRFNIDRLIELGY